MTTGAGEPTKHLCSQFFFLLQRFHKSTQLRLFHTGCLCESGASYEHRNAPPYARHSNQLLVFRLQSIRSSRSLASLFTEPPECVLGLNTIASSPLDSTLPSTEPDLPARPRKVRFTARLTFSASLAIVLLGATRKERLQATLWFFDRVTETIDATNVSVFLRCTTGTRDSKLTFSTVRLDTEPPDRTGICVDSAVSALWPKPAKSLWGWLISSHCRFLNTRVALRVLIERMQVFLCCACLFIWSVPLRRWRSRTGTRTAGAATTRGRPSCSHPSTRRRRRTRAAATETRCCSTRDTSSSWSWVTRSMRLTSTRSRTTTPSSHVAPVTRFAEVPRVSTAWFFGQSLVYSFRNADLCFLFLTRTQFNTVLPEVYIYGFISALTEWFSNVTG